VEPASLAEIEALESAAAIPSTVDAPKKRPRRQPKNKQDALTIALPVFASMRQCHAVAAIPIKLQQEAKDGGSTAIDQSGRVDLQKLLRWIFSQDERSVDWGSELRRYQALREKIRLESDQKQVLDRGEVQTAIARGMSVMLTKIDNEFGLMLPPILKGLPEDQIQKKLLEAAENFKASFRGELKALMSTPVVDTFTKVTKPKYTNE
jgi:hypothetical protein